MLRLVWNGVLGLSGRDRDAEQKQDLDHPANGQLTNKKGAADFMEVHPLAQRPITQASSILPASRCQFLITGRFPLQANGIGQNPAFNSAILVWVACSMLIIFIHLPIDVLIGNRQAVSPFFNFRMHPRHGPISNTSRARKSLFFDQPVYSCPAQSNDLSDIVNT